jgi:hypothetical protein
MLPVSTLPSPVRSSSWSKASKRTSTRKPCPELNPWASQSELSEHLHDEQASTGVGVSRAAAAISARTREGIT